MSRKKFNVKITFWHVLLLVSLIAIATWWWFDMQIHLIDSKIETMQNQ